MVFVFVLCFVVLKFLGVDYYIVFIVLICSEKFFGLVCDCGYFIGS